MSEYIGVGGAWKTKAAEWIGVGGSWKVIAAEWIGVGGAWKIMYSALAIDASPNTAYGGGSGFSPSGPVESELVSTITSGGSGYYTYQWDHVSTSQGNTPTATHPTASTSRFTATVSDGTDSISTWRVTVTDTTYGVTATDTVTVQLTWTNLT